MRVQAWAVTDVGCVKSQNEDSYLCDATQGVFVVADGVSGRAAGELASEALVAALRDQAPALVQQIEAGDALHDGAHREAVLRALMSAIAQANNQVFALGQRPEHEGGVATTLVSLWLASSVAFVAHVGDSRAYLLRGKEVFRVTEDHTYAQLLKKQSGGELTPEQERRYAHVLTRSIGTHPHVDVDVAFFDVIAGDRFLLCSDGLTDYVSGNEILSLSREQPPQTVAQQLVDLAKVRGGHDNITAVFAVFEGAGKPQKALRVSATPHLDTLKKIDFLGEIALFRDLSRVELLHILRVVYERSCEPGEVIVREGEPQGALYLIAQGQVEVRQAGQVVATLRVGENFGEQALFEHANSAADVVCTERALLLTLPHMHLEALIREEATLGNKLLWNLSRQLSSYLRRMNARVVGEG